MPDHTEQEQNLPEPNSLRFLRQLVSFLTGTMIIGVIGVFVLLFIRLNQEPDQPTFKLILPDNVAIHSYSVTDDHFFIVGVNSILYVLDSEQTLIKTVSLK